jgi:hypothetical protein
MMNGIATIVICSNKKVFVRKTFAKKKMFTLSLRERDKAHGQLENKFSFNGVFLGGDQWVLIIHSLLSFFFLDCS